MADLEVQYSVQFTSFEPGGLIVTGSKVGGDGDCEFFAQWQNVDRFWPHTSNLMKRKRSTSDVIPRGKSVPSCFCLSYSSVYLRDGGVLCPQMAAVPWPAAFILDISSMRGLIQFNPHYDPSSQLFDGICEDQCISPNVIEWSEMCGNQIVLRPGSIGYGFVNYYAELFAVNVIDVPVDDQICGDATGAGVGSNGQCYLFAYAQFGANCAGGAISFDVGYEVRSNVAGIQGEAPALSRNSSDPPNGTYGEFKMSEWDGVSPIPLLFHPVFNPVDNTGVIYEMGGPVTCYLYPAN